MTSKMSEFCIKDMLYNQYIVPMTRYLIGSRKQSILGAEYHF